MEIEPQQDRLKDLMSSTYLEILSRNRELLEGVGEAFKKAFETGDFDASVVSAALYLIEHLSGTLREGVDNGIENVIFSKDHSLKDQPLIQVQDNQSIIRLEDQRVDLSSKPEDTFIEPQTFGDLLFLRLDKALPDGQESFTREELERFAGDIRAAKEILESKPGVSFSREETRKILQQILTTPGPNSTHKNSFNKLSLMQTFSGLRANILNEFSSEIGHDWSKTPTVDFDTAMQIRGLGMLGKLKLPPKTNA